MGKTKTGEILRELRTKKGFSQKQLAEMLNVAQNTISQYENGTREPDAATLIKLANFFSVSTDYLLGRNDIIDDIQTIAAHHDVDWTEEELEEIERFKEFVRMKRQQQRND